MARRIWHVAVLAMVVGGASVQAEPVGSPAGILKKGKWVMGLGGGVFTERTLDSEADATAAQLGHFRGYGLTDWLSLYGKIGGVFLQMDDPSIKKPNDASTTHAFGAGVALGLGVKTRLWRSDRFGCEWDGSVQFLRLRARHRGENDARWHEWDFATSVAKAFGRLKPYVGMKYSLLDFDFLIRNNGALLKQGTYQQDTGVGAFVGADVSLGEGEDVILNLETSYTDGPELNVALQYTF